MDALGQKNSAMTEYGHVTNKYDVFFNLRIILNFKGEL